MEEFLMGHGNFLGVTLDISLSHFNGKRILDVVKEQLIKFVRNTIDGEDLFFIYDSEELDPVYDIGKIVSEIGNYYTDGCVYDLRQSFKFMYYLMLVQDDDMKKTLLFITDRITDRFAVNKIISLEDREESLCDIVFVGIGDNYDKSILETKCNNIKHIHINDPGDLFDVLMGD